MDELESRLRSFSVRQLVVAMRIMAPGSGTLGFDYSKVNKEELLNRALKMASGLPGEQRAKILRMLGDAFGWKADTSGKATGVGGGGSGKDAGSVERALGGDDASFDYGGSDEGHGPSQGGSAREDGKLPPGAKTREEIMKGAREAAEKAGAEAAQKAVEKAMEKKTDELMERLSKSVFKIEVESSDDGEDDEGDESSEGEDGEQEQSEGGEEGSEENQDASGKQKEGAGKGKGKKKKRVISGDHPRHEVFREVCEAVNKGLNVLLVGPAGCGKTHMAQDIAKTLDLPFKFTGAVSSEYKLLGFITAQGSVVRTEYREAYENGGLFLWDELDGSSAQALLSFNAGLANGHQDFPDKVVPQHKQFRAMASANTYGNGADRMYIGRNQLDAASLDRFYVVSMDYDDQLEQALYGRGEWVTYVQSARRAMREIGGIRHVISMRAIQMGLKMETTGVSREQVEQACLWRHLRQDDIEKIKRAMK